MLRPSWPAHHGSPLADSGLPNLFPIPDCERKIGQRPSNSRSNGPLRSKTRAGLLDSSSAPWNREVQRGFRSEEHTSELQSLTNLVCRLLLEKKKKNNQTISIL